MPIGAPGLESASSVSPATMVGSANGRSMRALTIRLPRNSSRTSTQAISVPVTTFTTTTASETSTVSFSAATASGPLTASQKPVRPASNERTTTAASGMSTIRLSHATASAPAGAARPIGRRPGRGRARLSAGGDTQAPLDLGDLPLVRTEELVVDLRPAAELVEGEQLRRVGEPALVGHRLLHRAIALGHEDPLGLRRADEVHERSRRARVLRLRGHGDRVLDEDRLVGDHVLQVLALLLGGDRLVLVGQEDVALARRERLERLARTLVLHGHVLEQRLDVVQRLLPGPALLQLGAVGGHDVPLGAARGERVGLDHLDARL